MIKTTYFLPILAVSVVAHLPLQVFGDGIVKCVDPATYAETYEILEIYEGKTKYGLTYKNFSRMNNDQREIYLRDTLMQNEKVNALAKEAFLAMNQEVEDNDFDLGSGNINLPPHCTLEQASDVSSDSMNAFVLKLHQLYYFMARKNLGATDSIKVRRLLAYAASDQAHHRNVYFFRKILNKEQRKLKRYLKEFAKKKR